MIQTVNERLLLDLKFKVSVKLNLAEKAVSFA